MGIMPDRMLIRDKEVAIMVGMSASWVRVQRFKRRRGLDHSFKVDPLLIGTSPRYRITDVTEWLSSLNDQNQI